MKKTGSLFLVLVALMMIATVLAGCAQPTAAPTEAPVVEPTTAPVVEPTAAPVVEPTAAPVVEPTAPLWSPPKPVKNRSWSM